MKIYVNRSWPETLGTQLPSYNFLNKLYASNGPKILMLVSSVIFSIIIVLVICAIIWYERNGSDEKKCLPKRLYLHAWQSACFWLCILLPFDIVRYCFGPFPTQACQFIYYLKAGITMQGILILDSILISRYIFIFFLKNPAGVYDHFWSTFLIIWIALFTWISQFVVMIAPTRHFVEVYVCAGVDPSTDFVLPERNYLFDYTFKLMSFLLHLITGMHIEIYKWKLTKINAVYHPRSKSFWLFSVNKDTLVTDIWEGILNCVLLAFCVMLTLQKRHTDLYKLNEYPYNVSEYFYTLIRPLVAAFILICIKFLRDKKIKGVLMREIQDQLCNN